MRLAKKDNTAKEMSGITPYHYSALQDKNRIRVLELSMNQGTCLQAKLKEQRLDRAPKYEALSYEWGNPQKAQKIIIDQHSYIRITESLYSALRSIRDCGSSTSIRRLWADAVCINQEDKKEKGEQVNLMGIIYKSAQQIITYTGGNIAGIDIGVKLATKLIEYGAKYASLPRGIVISPPYHLKKEFPASAWLSLRELLSRNWYTRMWIIQESMVSDKMIMMCGTSELSWTLFMQLCDVSSRWDSLPQDSDFPLIYPNDERRTGALAAMTRLKVRYRLCGGLPLLPTLQCCRDLDCTNPKDRVFALTLVCPEQTVLSDYKRSVGSIYVEVAKSQLLMRGLAVLSFAGARRRLNIPSWAPDWSTPSLNLPVLDLRRSSVSATEPWMRFDNDKVLRVRGRVVGIVDHLTSIMHYSLVTARLKRYYWGRNQFRRLTRHGHNYRGGGTVFEALWRSIILNIDPDNPPNDAPSLAANTFKIYMQPDKQLAKEEASRWMSSRLPKLELAPPPVDSLVESAWSYEKHMKLDPFYESGDLEFSSIVNSCTNRAASGNDNDYLRAILKAGNMYRRLCMTTSGYIGMVPEEARRFDLIVCFDGGTIPFVIRYLRPNEFSLIGDCYIHGLMNGEAYREPSMRSEIIPLR